MSPEAASDSQDSRRRPPAYENAAERGSAAFCVKSAGRVRVQSTPRGLGGLMETGRERVLRPGHVVTIISRDGGSKQKTGRKPDLSSISSLAPFNQEATLCKSMI
jgi:3,4-dihydroxy-2-butanone 4-phosphate synthase